MSSQGSAFVMKFFSILTASLMILVTLDFVSLCLIFEYKRQAKSVCIPSSRAMNSLLVVRPGITPLFFSQKIEQKAPLKKIPSTTAKATSLVAKSASLALSHCLAQSAFFWIAGIVVAASKSFCFSVLSSM